MLRKSTFHTFGIAALMAIFLCCTVASAPAATKKKVSKLSAKSECLLPQPRFSLLDSCRLGQKFIEPVPPPLDLRSASPSSPSPRNGILPFIGKDRNLATPPLPERPAIAAADPLFVPPPEQVVAGFTYSQDDRLFFNFGYRLPTAPLQEYAQPFGFSLTDEEDVKQISIGIDIAF